MPIPPPLWGFFGLFAGPWKFVIVALVALVFYGRRMGPIAARWASLSPAPRPGQPPRPRPRFGFGDRVYLFLVVMAATALAAWIVTRAMIVSGTSRP